MNEKCMAQADEINGKMYQKGGNIEEAKKYKKAKQFKKQRKSVVEEVSLFRLFRSLGTSV